MSNEKISKELLKNLNKYYKKLKRLFSIKGVERGRNINCSLPCEKAVILSIMKILKGKNYKYEYDKYFDDTRKWQPDLIIRNRNNEIVAVIEIKYQIGYWMDNNKYQDDINKLKDYNEEDKIIYVNFLEGTRSNDIKNVIEFLDKPGTNIKFYTLYNKNVKYNNIENANPNDIYDGENGFIAFFDRIRNL